MRSSLTYRLRSSFAAEEDRLDLAELTKTMPLDSGLREIRLRPDDLDLQARLPEAIDVVPAVSPHVVALPESAKPLHRVRYSGILVSRGGDDVGYLQQRPPSRPQDARDLPHGAAVVWDVLEDVIADHCVEPVLVEVEIGDV